MAPPQSRPALAKQLPWLVITSRSPSSSRNAERAILAVRVVELEWWRGRMRENTMRDQDETSTERLHRETGDEASEEPPTVRLHAASVPIVAQHPALADAIVTPEGQQS